MQISTVLCLSELAACLLTIQVSVYLHCRGPGAARAWVESKGSAWNTKTEFDTSVTELVEAVRRGKEYWMFCLLGVFNTTCKLVKLNDVAKLADEGLISIIMKFPAPTR